MENLTLENFFINSFNSLKDFLDSIQLPSKFYGAGSFEINDSRYSIITLNNSVYLVEERKINNSHKFETIHELEKTFLMSSLFTRGRQIGEIKYHNFDTDLDVEIKLYEYSNEKRLIINPLNKIDLLYSIHLHHDDEQGLTFDMKSYPSLEPVIKMDKMMKKLDARVNTMNQKN